MYIICNGVVILIKYLILCYLYPNRYILPTLNYTKYYIWKDLKINIYYKYIIKYLKQFLYIIVIIIL